MSDTLKQVQGLIAAGDVLISAHGVRELGNDGIAPATVLSSVSTALVVEDYPSHLRGPCVLVLQRDAPGQPLHILWGLRKVTSRPAVLITAYRPDPAKWSPDLVKRLT